MITNCVLDINIYSLKSRKECAMLFSRCFNFPSLLGILLYGVLFNGQLAKTSSLNGNQDVEILPNNHVMFYGEWGMFTCKSKIPGNFSWNYSNQEYIHSFKIQEKLFSSFLNITIVAEGQGLIELNISCLVTIEEPVEAVHTSQARLYVQFKDPFSKYPNPYITPLVQTFVTQDVTFLCTVPCQANRTPGIITWTHTNDITAYVNSGEWWSQIKVTKGFLISNGREEERHIWCHYQSYNQSSIVMSVARLFVQSTVYPAISPLEQTCVQGRGAVFTCSVWPTRQFSGHFEWYRFGGIRNATISYGFLESTLDLTRHPYDGAESTVHCEFYWNRPGTKWTTAYAREIYLPASKISETTCFCEGNDSYSGSPTPVNGSLTLSCGLEKIGDKKAKCVETQKNSCLWSSFDETQCVGFNYSTTVKEIHDFITEGNYLLNSLDALRALTDSDTNKLGGMTEGNIVASVDALYNLAVYIMSSRRYFSSYELEMAHSVFSHLIDEINIPSWDRTKEHQHGTQKNSVDLLVASIRAFTVATLRWSFGGVTINETNIGAQIGIQNEKNLMCEKEVFMKHGVKFTNMNDNVTLPNSFLRYRRLGCHIFKTMHRIMQPKGSKFLGLGSISQWVGQGNFTLVQAITWGSLSSLSGSGLEVSFAFQPKADKLEPHYNYQPECASWSDNLTEWEPRGCSKVRHKSSDTAIVCECEEFSFTSIVEVVYEFTRNLKSRISCYLSIAVLITSALAYATVWKNILSTQSYIYVNLCIALVLTNCFMAISTQVPFNNLVSCVSVIVFMNLFRMAAMILLAAEALLSVKEEDAFDKKLSVTGLCSGIAAYCIAGLIVGITVTAVGNKTYVFFRQSHINCHMTSEYEEPVLDAYVAPITIFAMVAVIVDGLNLWEKESKNRAISFRNIILTLVMYITWIMGLLIHNGSVEDIIFTILNSIQSIIIATLGLKNVIFRKAIEEKRNGSSRGIDACVNGGNPEHPIEENTRF